MKERELGLKIKRELDQSLDLDAAVLSRLKTAREQALAHQRVKEPVFVLAWAGSVMDRLSGNPTSASIAIAAGALIIALIGVQYWQQSPSVEEIEEIDAALLTGDLPFNAYLDKSFDTWLKRSQH